MRDTRAPVSDLREAIDRDGYVIVPDAVPSEALAAVLADVERHTETSLDDPATWCRSSARDDVYADGGMVEMYHYQSMWDVRQDPRMHGIFSALWGTDALWVSIDRICMKPPNAMRPAQNDFIHWDVDITKYPDIPFFVQGVLALTDTDDDMGGFQCVPEVYRDLEAWLALHAAEFNGEPRFSHEEITRVPMRAGDLLIWSGHLPHGNGLNRSDRLRLAQYVMMNRPRDDGARDERIAAWRGKAHAFGPGHPANRESFTDDPPAALTPLGRRLLGLDPWEDSRPSGATAAAAASALRRRATSRSRASLPRRV